jgi:uncharacterized protein YcsI (UPF0317 family)
MPAEIGIRIEGLDALVRSMRKAGVDISELKEAHIRAAAIVADRAAELAPRRSGRLAGSVRPAKQAKRARIQAGSAKVPYANPIHWGWPSRNIASQPFLSDAAQQTEAEWTAAYLEDVQAALDKVRGA